MPMFFSCIEYHVKWCSIIYCYIHQNCILSWLFFLSYKTAGLISETWLVICTFRTSYWFYIKWALQVWCSLTNHIALHLYLFESGVSASQAVWAWHPPLYVCNYGEVGEPICFPTCFFPFILIYHSRCISIGHLFAFM